MKLLIAVPAEGSAPLLDFFGALDEKQRQKLLSLFALLLQSPAAVMREPYVKHFCIERYQALYELRAKSKNLVRIIFTLTDDGDILFLTPFIKRHKRNTMQALDRSLDCLTHIRDGSCSTQELSIKFFLNGGTTDARGVAASKPLPLTRYKIREVTAPAYFQLDPTIHDVTLEYAGQIIKIAAYDKPANLKVTVTKTGNKQLLAGDSMRYDLTVANNSNVALENFYLHDRFPTDCATAKTITTGTYNTRLNYQITYKTNYNDYRVLATNLLSTNNYAFDLSAIPLMQGEVVTDVRLEFGKVPAGFASMVKPTITIQTSASLANGYQVVNRADAGGQYMSQWETGRAAWITLIVKLNQPNLPKTGY